MHMFHILFVGCGGMGNTWMKYILSRKDVVVEGLCDIDPEHMAEYAERYGLCAPRFERAEAAFLALDGKINLVIDCTTPESHASITIAAMRAGCDVLGEKPMADARAGALAQLAAADETGKLYAVMQNRIYQPYMRALRTAVDNELVGRIGFLSADFFIGAHFGGFRDLMDNPLILDMAVHTFYQATFILGAKPLSVYCHEFNPAGSWYKGNASAIAIFEMDTGAVFEYRGSWCAEGMNTSWESQWRAIGDMGTILWDGTNKPAYEISIPGDGFIREQAKGELDYEGPDRERLIGHEGCFDEMFLSLSEKRPAETDCHVNYISMNMVYAAIESAKSGRKIVM